MYQAILHTHSGLRWIVLILIVAAIFNALTAKGRTEYSKKDRLLNLFAMVSMHLQVVIGVILSLTTEKVFYHEGWMKSSASRFFGMEHILMMLIAAVVLTIGRKKAEKSEDLAKRNKTIVLWYSIGLIIILAAIPWPFRFGNGWF